MKLSFFCCAALLLFGCSPLQVKLHAQALQVTLPRWQPLDNNGKTVPGGKVCTYVSGSFTPQATYTNSGGGTPLSNPVILDSAGRADIWFGNGLSYRVVFQQPGDNNCPGTGASIWTQDNVSNSSGGLPIPASLIGTSSGPILTVTNNGAGYALSVTAGGLATQTLLVNEIDALTNTITGTPIVKVVPMLALTGTGGLCVASSNTPCSTGSIAHNAGSMVVSGNTSLMGGLVVGGSSSQSTFPGWILSSNSVISDSQYFKEEVDPGLSSAGQSEIYMDSTTHTLRVSQNGGAYTNLVGSLTPPVTLSANSGSNILTLTNSGAGGALNVTAGATALQALSIAGNFTGTHAQNIGPGDSPVVNTLTVSTGGIQYFGGLDGNGPSNFHSTITVLAGNLIVSAGAISSATGFSTGGTGGITGGTCSHWNGGICDTP